MFYKSLFLLHTQFRLKLYMSSDGSRSAVCGFIRHSGNLRVCIFAFSKATMQWSGSMWRHMRKIVSLDTFYTLGFILPIIRQQLLPKKCHVNLKRSCRRLIDPAICWFQTTADHISHSLAFYIQVCWTLIKAEGMLFVTGIVKYNRPLFIKGKRTDRQRDTSLPLQRTSTYDCELCLQNRNGLNTHTCVMHTHARTLTYTHLSVIIVQPLNRSWITACSFTQHPASVHICVTHKLDTWHLHQFLLGKWPLEGWGGSEGWWGWSDVWWKCGRQLICPVITAWCVWDHSGFAYTFLELHQSIESSILVIALQLCSY